MSLYNQSEKYNYLWLLGCLPIKNPYFLRNALEVVIFLRTKGVYEYKTSKNLSLLGEELVKSGIEFAEETWDIIGLKWRSALNKMGFLFPEIDDSKDYQQADIGLVNFITPSGWRLIHAESVPATQECFLRALAAYYIPSPIEPSYTFPVFSPLRHTLAIMLKLEEHTGESYLNFIEMATIVQFSNSHDNYTGVIDLIVDLRSRRNQAANKKRFDSQEVTLASSKTQKANGKPYEPQTLNDYADTNFRYLKATGLVHNKGRGIAFVEEKHFFIGQLIQEANLPESAITYYQTLVQGARLPTDNKESALAVLDDLLKQAKSFNISVDISAMSLATPADIGFARHQIESQLAELKEEMYSAGQIDKWQEICAYMDLIINGKSNATINNGEEIQIPKAEAPAYLEWVLWRAFLSIDSLINKPYNARRFKIDQDFLPVGTAPGNGPDLIFEFKDYVLVVEVTLTSNSRQEAAEGEPVRRHVAKIVESYNGKKVFGLFIANKIDTNTAETLRIGYWYRPDDSKMALQIVPITLKQFRDLFHASFSLEKMEPRLIKDFIQDCLTVSNNDAPEWKRQIQRAVNEKIEVCATIEHIEISCKVATL